MKKAVIIILSLICLIVCSCEKTLHQRQLVGSWAVTKKTTTSGSLEGENTVDGFVYTFDKEGHGTIVRNDRVSSFSYQCKTDSLTIVLDGETTPEAYRIDVLTEKTFVVSNTYAVAILGKVFSQYTTLTGKKLDRS